MPGCAGPRSPSKSEPHHDREEARQVEQQLTKRHPGDTVEVTRVPGGVWVEARNKGGWTFLHVAVDSPLLTLLGAYPETEPGDLPGPDR